MQTVHHSALTMDMYSDLRLAVLRDVTTGGQLVVKWADWMGTTGAEMTAAATADLRDVCWDTSKAVCLDDLMVYHSTDSMVDARGDMMADWTASQQVEWRAPR